MIQKTKFNAKIEQYKEQTHDNMIKHVRVKKEIVKRIPVVPAGHQCMRSSLLGSDWSPVHGSFLKLHTSNFSLLPPFSTL